MDPIKILNSNVSLPFEFTTKLDFSAQDKLAMPWLNNPVRYYGIEEKKLKAGGRAIAYKGFISDKSGMRIPNTPLIVMKIPNLNSIKFHAKSIKDYLNRQNEECQREWHFTRARLYTCKYANAIFDFHCHQLTYLEEPIMLPMTAQFFLQESTLDDYLLRIGQRTEPHVSQRDGQISDNWHGIPDPSKWIEIARCIAIGLLDIHQRRMVHGDIWPPNIFIKTDSEHKPSVIFIDFGESFPIEPKGDPKIQPRDHAYRAPERKDAKSIVTRQADVYSFGKLLLYLAVGTEPIIDPRNIGYQRRLIIKKLFERNPAMSRDNPFIIDIICKCISVDPVDRPNMNEVLRALNSYVDPSSYSIRVPTVSERLASLTDTWKEITTDLNNSNKSVGPFIEELVEQKIQDVEEMIKGLSDDIIILNDTRERLILSMISLFRRLNQGDRFISITSPLMWRSSALGLDGRYFSATELATVRGASIQRAFIFSVEEIGSAWASKLAAELEQSFRKGGPAGAKSLAKLLRDKIKAFEAAKRLGESRDIPIELQKDARSQLVNVIKMYHDANLGICKDMFDKSDSFECSDKCRGIYLGLIPVSTISEMWISKSAHPISVFYYSTANITDQYLLMMTDCVARNSYSYEVDNESHDSHLQRFKPELRGIMVYKSKLGVPEDRIKTIEDMFQKSVNIGGWLSQFCTILSDPNVN